MRLKPVFAISIVSLVLAAPIAAASITAADRIKARQAGYKQLGRDFKALGDEIRGGTPNPATVKARAVAMSAAAAKIPGWFPRGSGPEAGVKTAAKAEIWKSAPDFKTKAATLGAEATKMAKLAGAGDSAAMTAQLKAIGASCKACHTAYRAE